MQDPDMAENYLKMAELKPSELLKGETPRLIDEWQDAPVLWNGVRHLVDSRGERGQFILTGSTIPKLAKNMHSGAGRIARMEMRTMSLYESNDSTGEISLRGLFDGEVPKTAQSRLEIDDIAYILLRGGWPETIKETESSVALKTVRNYITAVAYEDMTRVDGKKRNPLRVLALMRSLAHRFAKPFDMLLPPSELF